MFFSSWQSRFLLAPSSGWRFACQDTCRLLILCLKVNVPQRSSGYSIVLLKKINKKKAWNFRKKCNFTMVLLSRKILHNFSCLDICAAFNCSLYRMFTLLQASWISVCRNHLDFDLMAEKQRISLDYKSAENSQDSQNSKLKIYAVKKFVNYFLHNDVWILWYILQYVIAIYVLHLKF